TWTSRARGRTHPTIEAAAEIASCRGSPAPHRAGDDAGARREPGALRSRAVLGIGPPLYAAFRWRRHHSRARDRASPRPIGAPAQAERFSQAAQEATQA